MNIFYTIRSRKEALDFLEWLCKQLPDGFHGEDDLTKTVPTGDFALDPILVELAEIRRQECLHYCIDICADIQRIAARLGQDHALP